MVRELDEWVALDVRTFRRVPPGLHARFAAVSESICSAIYSATTLREAELAFLLFLCHHRLLLAAVVPEVVTGPKRRRTKWDRRQRDKDIHQVVARRLALFETGRWTELLEVVQENSEAWGRFGGSPGSGSDTEGRKLASVVALARARQFRKAVQRLLSLGVLQGPAEEVVAKLRSKFFSGQFPQAEPSTQ